MAVNNERGQALLEGIPVFALLFSFLFALLLVLYVFFGRAWIQFQAEQSLLCLSEQRTQSQCRTQLEAKLDHFLAFGTWHVRMASSASNWNVDVEWKIKDYAIHVVKNLNLEAAAKTRVSL